VQESVFGKALFLGNSAAFRDPDFPLGADFSGLGRLAGQLLANLDKENPSWGYDRVVGALANLGHQLSDQTVGYILRRHDIPPAPKRKYTTSWKDFIRAHLDVLAGTDTVAVVTLQGLVTYYVLFFIHLESRKVCLAGMTPDPHEEWMKQIARNVTLETWGFLENCKYLLHDRDGTFCPSFDQIIESGKAKPILLPARSPNLNSYAERWVRSVKEECLSKLILFGESSLKRAFNNTKCIIMKNGIIKAKRTNCCFRGRLNRPVGARDRFNLTNDWEGYSNITTARLHEYSIRDRVECFDLEREVASSNSQTWVIFHSGVRRTLHRESIERRPFTRQHGPRKRLELDRSFG
jgi:hypothetical protein